MKKKIKDLTFEEAKVICRKTSSCDECPLCFTDKISLGVPCYLDKLRCDRYTTYEQLNKEIEIDESNNDEH